ncbi:hypothetical protein HHK36_025900 [Tetracentron sinense]|uniref:Nicastrin n=1 Tax=Tetracentron sinense TaxID=13715 RepID=A0A835D607_TETSI|nr:hypothetical protein HHK36_025900 [Tetracentron sinense]
MICIYGHPVDGVGAQQWIDLASYKFTWNNKRADDAKVQERLDRVLATVGWRHTFENARVIHLAATGSDHCPARDILVGSKTDAWKIPSSESDSLNRWAEGSRFQVGDSLVWKYNAEEDSVLQVTKKDYLSCNVSSSIAEYKDGNTKVKLDRSGPFYFISGVKGNCEKGQKLIVVVLSGRHRFMGISPAPSPMEYDGPAMAPTSSAASLRGGLMVVLVGTNTDELGGSGGITRDSKGEFIAAFFKFYGHCDNAAAKTQAMLDGICVNILTSVTLIWKVALKILIQALEGESRHGQYGDYPQSTELDQKYSISSFVLIAQLHFSFTGKFPGREKVVAPIIRFKHANELVYSSVVLVSLDEMQSLFSRVSNDLNFAEKVVGVLVELGTEIQNESQGFSPVNKFLQAEFAPYQSLNYEWNPVGSGIMWNSYNFPVFLLSRDSTLILQKIAIKNEEQKKAYTVDVAEFDLVMQTTKAGTHDSESCLQEQSCLPLGGHSVWSSLPPINISSSKWTKPLLLAVASMDSASFFRDKSIGADSRLSGLISLLAAVSNTEKFVIS